MAYWRSGIHSIDNYAEAVARWEGIKPIRGRDVTCKPLGRRNYVDSFRIFKRESDGAIQCILYNTPVVTFTPEDNIVIDTAGFNNGGSTRKFIDEVAPCGLSAVVFDGSMCLRIANPTLDAANSKGDYRLQRKRPTLLRRTQTGWVVMGADKRAVHKVNRKGKKAMLDRYKPFFDYLDAFCRLRVNEKVGEEEIQEVLGDNYAKCAGSQGRKEDRYALLMGYMASTGEEQHVDYYRAVMCLCCEVYGVDAVQMKGILTSILSGAHRDEVFVTEVVPEGKVKKDAYDYYFKTTWDEYHEAHPTRPTWQAKIALAG